MGLWEDLFGRGNNTEEDSDIKIYTKLLKSMKENETLYEYNKAGIASYLKLRIDEQTGNIDIPFTASEFIDIIRLLEKHHISLESKFTVIEEMYKKIVIDKNNLEQRQYFFKMFEASFDDNFKLAEIILFKFPYIMDIFENKELFLSMYQYLAPKTYHQNHSYCVELLEYIKRARIYYVDEFAFFTNIINVYDSHRSHLDDAIINELINEDKRFAGIYDVSYKEIEALANRLDEIKKEADTYSGTMKKKFSEIEEGIQSLMNSYAIKIKKEFESLSSQIGAYNDKAKSSMVSIDEVISSFRSSFSTIKKELDMATSNLLKGEVIRLTDDYEASVKLINELISNSSNLGENERNIIRELGRKYLTLISATIDKEKEYVGPTISGGVNKYLDSSRPLKERLEEALANKSPNQLYHSSFDKMIKEILNNNVVYLVGPSGSCKTYSVKQAAELLGLPLYDFGFVTDEHETFKSYKDVNGTFVKNNFYEAYKTGGICFFDEIDNSESKALVELNRIIGGNGEYEPYLFPNGELVYPHPNFRVVSTGNTGGEGANEAYSTRERLDFGTIDRFSLIRYYYDEPFERQVLNDYPEVYQFCMAYRRALTMVNDEYYFTTRKIFKIKKNLDSGCYSMDEIIEDFFIKNFRSDVLSQVLQKISIDNNNPYYVSFKEKVEGKKNSAKIRVRGR